MKEGNVLRGWGKAEHGRSDSAGWNGRSMTMPNQS